jgi:hypothetical protein
VFPIPTFDHVIWFDYIVNQERDAQAISTGSYYQVSGSSSSTTPEIGDYSNVPYNFIQYQNINSVGRQWIWKYYLALCKEVLGSIRQKYQTIPVPGGEMTLDGAELRQEAQQEKTELMTQLRENLDATSRSKQMEMQSAQAQQLQESLTKVPLFIYVG